MVGRRGARYPRLPLLGAIVLVVAGCGGDAADPGGSASPSCAGIAGHPTSSTVDGGWTPVVFIHGFASSRAIWDAPLPGLPLSMVQQVARLPGAAAYTFDYSASALQWVDDPALAPTFATTLECLARFHHHRAVVVAHSMGGLVTRAAAVRRDPAGGTARDSIAAVVTLGTPYQGSELAEQDRRYGFVVSALCQAGAALHTPFPNVICALTTEPVRHSPALAALSPGSAQLAALPAWPPGLPVVSVAGEMTLTGQVAGSVVVGLRVGDGVVSVPSAVAGGSGGAAPVVDTCPAPIQSPGDVPALLGSRCFHVNLPANLLAAATVVRLVTDVASRGPLAGASPSPGA